ncbi:MAG TPA: fused MFS/spermidine synthase [Solirubrobacteraceae bacterium]|jgi:spermidine synthase
MTRVRVLADGARRRMLVDGLEAAVVDRDDPTHLDFPYMRWIADVLDVGWRGGAPLQAVHVGGGGCVLPRYLAATRPGSHSEVYENDPAVLDALATLLDLRAERGLRVRLGDGRELLAGRAARSADVVVTDAFAGPVVPAHLTTLEYQAEVRRVLRPGGVHIVNVIDEPPGRIARRQAATLTSSFFEVVLIAPRAVVAGRRTGNVVFAAADRTLSLARLQARTTDEVLGPAEVAVLAGGAAPLRDR